MKTVLVSVVGMSPAVLTETVWALAQENPPVIPDEVVAITTSVGKEKIKSELFIENPVWEALRSSLGASAEGKLRFGADASIQVMGDGARDFPDISTVEENELCADAILRAIRQYSEEPETQIIASIAGGRKTMSALMLACMSLVGREQDRVCHVLADDDFIFVNKAFYFPRNNQEVEASQIQLSEIPFIRVRGWYKQETGQNPPSYSHMVSLFRKKAPEAIVWPKVVLQVNCFSVVIDETSLILPEAEFVAVWWFLRSRLKGDFCDAQGLAEGVAELRIPSLSDGESFSKRLSSAKAKLKKFDSNVAENLFPGIKARTFSYERLEFCGRLRMSKK